MVTFPQAGGCHCGAVRYEITEAPVVIYTCHCTDCQHFTASAFSMGVMVREDSFLFKGVAPRVIECRADSGRIKRRCVCAHCANWVFGQPFADRQMEGVFRTVRGGTLDDTSWLKPTIHFWTQRKQPWIILPEGDQQYATQPD